MSERKPSAQFRPPAWSVAQLALLCMVLIPHDLWAGEQEGSFAYFCPRVNATLQENADRLIGKVSSRLPKNMAELSADPRPTLEFRMKDCSNAEFLCLELAGLTEGYEPITLFVPRVINHLREYTFRGVHAFVTYPAATGKLDRAAQVMLWQSGMEDEGTDPVVLTALEGKGAIYLDGLALPGDRDRTVAAGTCILQSTSGIFSELRISRSRQKPSSLSD